MTTDLKYLISKKPQVRKRRSPSKFLSLFIVIIVIPIVWICIGYYHLSHGKAHLYRGEYDQSIRHFLLSSRTGIYPVQSRTGVEIIRFINGHKTRVFEDIKSDIYLKCLDSDFKSSRILELLVQSKNFGAAKVLCHSLLKLDPKVEYYYFLGLSYFKEGMNDRAIENFLKIIDDSEYGIKAETQLQLIEEIYSNPRFSRLTDRNSKPIFHDLFSNSKELPKRASVISIVDTLAPDLKGEHAYLQLTIDDDIQKVCEEFLKESEGIITFISPSNGEVLAMAGSEGENERGFFLRKIETGMISILPLILSSRTTPVIKQVLMGNFTANKPVNLEKDSNLQKELVQMSYEQIFNIFKKSGFNMTVPYLGSGELIAEISTDDVSNHELISRIINGQGIRTSPIHLAAIAAEMFSGIQYKKPELIISRNNLLKWIELFDLHNNLESEESDQASVIGIREYAMKNVEQFYKKSGLAKRVNDWGAISVISGGIRSKFCNVTLGMTVIDRRSVAFCYLSYDEFREETILRRIEKILYNINLLHNNT